MQQATSKSKRYQIEGVVVNYQPQPKAIRIKRLPLHIIKPAQMMGAAFQPFRFVINLKIVEDANPDKAVTVFSPPLELRVRYTAADYITAGGNLSLGYWDGNAWTRCPVKLVSRSAVNKGGWMVTIISQWGDPTVAVGT